MLQYKQSDNTHQAKNKHTQHTRLLRRRSCARLDSVGQALNRVRSPPCRPTSGLWPDILRSEWRLVEVSCPSRPHVDPPAGKRFPSFWFRKTVFGLRNSGKGFRAWDSGQRFRAWDSGLRLVGFFQKENEEGGILFKFWMFLHHILWDYSHVCKPLCLYMSSYSNVGEHARCVVCMSCVCSMPWAMFVGMKENWYQNLWYTQTIDNGIHHRWRHT
jgi:hypothetical protein